MLPKSTLEAIIPILKYHARRALKMKVEGFPAPYYCSFLLRDAEWFNTWAGSGSVYRRRSDRRRHVYCDLRVGSYRYDQTTDGGVNDNDEDRESMNHLSVPIDDRHYDGLRLGLWRLSESKFREALSDYNAKRSARINRVDPNGGLPSFTKLRKQVSIKEGKPELIDEEKWVRFCKSASLWMSELPHVSASWVEFDTVQETKVFVSTEGSTIVQHSQIFSLTATFKKITKEGSHLEQDLVINCATAKELPNMREFKLLALKKYQRLIKLMKARTIHAFSGPVLLCPGPAGLLFHEAIGHRIEGSRLLASGEGQTFKGQIGKKILDVDIDIRDNPKLKAFKKIRCVGAYDFDDEGTPARNALVVEHGILKDFLNTRAPLTRKNFTPNGHARNVKFQRPISRMAVTIVQAHKPVTPSRLRDLLLREIVKQKKPFGMIVYDTSGGETETTSYDFQAFGGEITYATLLYPDGKEVCVRGVNFIGTPLQALQNIIAVGDNAEIDNGFCGAESGFIPVTTIAPAVLLRSLELQAKEEEQTPQNLLPRPKR